MSGENGVFRAVMGVTAEAEKLVDRMAPPADRELIKRAADLPTRKKIALVRRLWRDERVRDLSRIPLLAGAAYAVLPIRVLPPKLGPLRDWEKLVGLSLLLWLIVRLTPGAVLREHLEAVERPGLLHRVLKRDGE